MYRGVEREKAAAELRKLDLKTPLGRGKFQPNDGTKNQAYTDMIA